ncbi:MAG: hypothetical protein JXB39_15610 [Deltaproteobacteria bacterium]|nr:hypothetical protein [Deltaproteobacteria bacterium]
MTRSLRTLSWPALALLLAACGGREEPAPPPPPPPAAPQAIDVDAARANAVNTSLTPSPAEMQTALTRAGIAESLATFMAARTIAVEHANLDQVAVRTGVVIADVVLTAKEAPKETLVARLGDIKKGLELLGGGKDLQATLDELITQVQSDAITRDRLVMEMDELSGAVIPEMEYEAGPRSVPLIQAGSWLEGANLVAAAVRKAQKPEAAGVLLRQPDVVGYFLGYVRGEGSTRAPDQVIDKLEASLKVLQGITGKPTLSAQDVEILYTETESVLKLL